MENECLDYKNSTMFLLCMWGHWSMSAPSTLQVYLKSREGKKKKKRLTRPRGLVNTVNVTITQYVRGTTPQKVTKKVTLTKSVATRVHQQPTTVLCDLDPYNMRH